VKPGWKKGTKITFAGKGNQQWNQLPADLVFVVDEKPHPFYRRDGNDLLAEARVTLAEALGSTVVVLSALDGRELAVDVGGGGGGEDDEDEEDNYAEFEHQQQQRMMREQDQHLDGVFQTVGNLRRQADDMGRELEEQREMLDFVDEAADRVGGRLQNGMHKLQTVIRRNEDRWSSCCIAVLITVLIIMLVLLLIL